MPCSVYACCLAGTSSPTYYVRIGALFARCAFAVRRIHVRTCVYSCVRMHMYTKHIHAAMADMCCAYTYEYACMHMVCIRRLYVVYAHSIAASAYGCSLFYMHDSTDNYEFADRRYSSLMHCFKLACSALS